MLALRLVLLTVAIYGFDDFTYDAVAYDNPARDIALSLGGQVVAVDWDTVENLDISGPAVGIGLDASAAHAYINGSAFGLTSLAADGPDAGDYECGHLYHRLLQAHPCSLFVHVPQEPSNNDLAMVERAIDLVSQCANSPRRVYLPTVTRKSEVITVSRLRSAIYRYWGTAMMFLYALLAPCSGGQCHYLTLTLAGIVMLVGIVFRRRWAFLLTLGVLCLCLTYSRAWLETPFGFGPTLGPCGLGPCIP